MRRHRQQGVALITAIMVVALATIAATALLAHSHAALRRSSNLFESEAAWWYAEGLESWGRTILKRDAADSQTDHLGEAWAVGVPALPVDQGLLTGEIIDLHGRFNINHLAIQQRQPHIEQFKRLIDCLGIDPFTGEQLINAIADWVDADDQQSFPGGAEELDYLGLESPYRIPNRPVLTVSELAAVRGMTREIYQTLRPHIAALPVDSGPVPINPNTATEPVLCSMALGGKPGPGLQPFIADRITNPLPDAQNAVTRNLFGAGFDPATITVNGEYFLLQAQAFIGTGRVALYSVVRRRSGTSPVTLSRRVDTD